MTDQLNLFNQHLYTPSNTQKEIPLPEQKNITSRKITEVLSWIFNYKFDYLKYSCYKIEVENWKISKVKFQIWNYKFQVYIDYDYKKEDIKNINYTETDKEDRENIIEKVFVKKLYISAIQKKDKVWYWPVQKNVNYFKFAWLEYNQIISFLKALILDYHK